MTQLYRMHDAEPRGVFPVASLDEARRWNAQGFGVFATVNEFYGARRIENLRRIVAWAVDIDAGTKDEQHARIHAAPLVPSRIVETRNGYHVHYHAKDAKAEHWDSLLLEHLVPYFGADKNARDLARILRVPGFLHLKDPSNPFPVRRVWSHGVAYTEEQIARAFPFAPDVSLERKRHAGSREEYQRDTARSSARCSAADGEDFWERVYGLDCAEGLARLSGHYAVGGEAFTLRRVRSGNQNILVNGKSTSCWVDARGRIGSLSGGGPSLYQWLRWYGNSPSECVRVLRELFPADLGDC